MQGWNIKRLAIVVIVSATAMAAFGQSNEFLDSLVQSKAVTFGQVSYLVLVSSDNIGEDTDVGRAFEFLQHVGWAPRRAKVDATIRLDEYALILSRAFDIRGSLMARLFPSPHYAYHSLASLEVIQGKSDPSMSVSGVQAIQMLGRVFDVLGLNK